MTNKSDKNNRLSEFITQKMIEKRLTSYDVQQRANNLINQSYVVKLKNGDVTNLSVAKLEALAKGLDVTKEELFSIVHGGSPSSQNIVNEQFQNLSQIFENLPASKRLHAQILINMIEREFKILANEK